MPAADDAVGWVRKTSTMMIDSFSMLQDAMRNSWGPDTCDPVDLADWHPGNPARGQCGVTVLVVNDLLGGDLVMADVTNADGTRQGIHYWNRIGLLDIDLTRNQFTSDEHIGTGTVLPRPKDAPTRCLEEYELLRTRVLAALGS
jgi:hypothetical protein